MDFCLVLDSLYGSKNRYKNSIISILNNYIFDTYELMNSEKPTIDRQNVSIVYQRDLKGLSNEIVFQSFEIN